LQLLRSRKMQRQNSVGMQPKLDLEVSPLSFPERHLATSYCQFPRMQYQQLNAKAVSTRTV
jgi:hypothetical protein